MVQAGVDQRLDIAGTPALVALDSSGARIAVADFDQAVGAYAPLATVRSTVGNLIMHSYTDYREAMLEARTDAVMPGAYGERIGADLVRNVAVGSHPVRADDDPADRPF